MPRHGDSVSSGDAVVDHGPKRAYVRLNPLDYTGTQLADTRGPSRMKAIQRLH